MFLAGLEITTVVSTQLMEDDVAHLRSRLGFVCVYGVIRMFTEALVSSNKNCKPSKWRFRRRMLSPWARGCGTPSPLGLSEVQDIRNMVYAMSRLIDEQVDVIMRKHHSLILEYANMHCYRSIGFGLLFVRNLVIHNMYSIHVHMLLICLRTA